MYKLAAIDLDGTMLNQYGIVTEETKGAIKKAQQNGMEIIIASFAEIATIFYTFTTNFVNFFGTSDDSPLFFLVRKTLFFL